MDSILKKKVNGQKKAEISVESMLMIVLGLLVVFVVFKVFFGGLYKMSSTTKMKSVYQEKSVEEANVNNTANYMDPNSQVSVQVMADPDAEIAGYHDNALIVLNDLVQTKNLRPLTLAEQHSLAKQLTIYGLSGDGYYTPDQLVYSLEPNIQNLRLTYNISLYFNTQKTIVNGTEISWKKSPNTNPVIDYSSSNPNQRLAVIQEATLNHFMDQ